MFPRERARMRGRMHAFARDRGARDPARARPPPLRAPARARVPIRYLHPHDYGTPSPVMTKGLPVPYSS